MRVTEIFHVVCDVVKYVVFLSLVSIVLIKLLFASGMTMTSGGDAARSGVEALMPNITFNSSQGTYQVNTTMANADKDPLISLQVPAIMFASGVFGNILAIFVLAISSKEHKQTVFYRLVGALACTDLFGTCATSPVTLAVYANNLQWVGGEALCNYESFMFIFAGYSTIFIIGTMAVDRFIALTKPFFYDTHITYSRAKFIILGLWAFAAFMGLLPVMGLGENVKQFPGSWCFFSFTSSDLKNQIFSYMYSVIGLMIICVTAVSNVVVTFTLLKMRRKAMRSMNGANTKRHDSELQMVILLLGIIVIFSTCWCPFLIRILINQSHQKQIDVKADLHALRLASFNQILDPWIYILFRKELFVRSFECVRKVFTSKCGCLCSDRCNEEYSDREERGETIGKSREIPFIKYENGDAPPLLADNEQCCLQENANSKDDESTALNGSCVRNPKSRVSRQVSFASTEEKDEMLPLKEIPGPTLHLKHSACLFCFSNHPKCVILSSKSMDGLHLLTDQETKCLDTHACIRPTNSDSRSNYPSKLRRESIHQSLTDMTGRTDECSSARNSGGSYQPHIVA